MNIYPRSRVSAVASNVEYEPRCLTTTECSITPTRFAVLSEPVNCPPSPPSDEEHEHTLEEESVEYYNAKTWDMYNRIMNCRKGGAKNSNSPTLSPQRNDPIGKARRRESQTMTNPAIDEMFHLEL